MLETPISSFFNREDLVERAAQATKASLVAITGLEISTGPWTESSDANIGLVQSVPALDWLSIAVIFCTVNNKVLKYNRVHVGLKKCGPGVSILAGPLSL